VPFMMSSEPPEIVPSGAADRSPVIVVVTDGGPKDRDDLLAVLPLLVLALVCSPEGPDPTED